MVRVAADEVADRGDPAVEVFGRTLGIEGKGGGRGCRSR